MNVTLREKEISKGRKSLYLDYYPPIPHPVTGRLTRREFLGLYITTKPITTEERDINKATKKKAEKIRALRQLAIAKEDYSFLGVEESDSIEELMKELVQDTHNPTSERLYTFLPIQLKEYAKRERLTFTDFTPAFCQGYINFLRDKYKTQNTAAQHATAFIKFINLSEKRDKVFNVRSKIKGIPVKKHTKREFLTEKELQKLKETPVKPYEQRRKDACLFSAYTGLRRSDILALKWDNIVEDNGRLFINFTQIKTDSPEYHPIPQSAVEFLGEREKGLVFKGLSKGKLERICRDWPPNAGIDRNITFHSFRHTFATRLLGKGVDISVVSKLLNHKDLATTMIYTHVGKQDKMDAIDKLDK